MDTGLDDLKTAPRKVIHKATGGTGEFIGNKIAKKHCENKACNWWEFKKYWRNYYSARE